MSNLQLSYVGVSLKIDTHGEIMVASCASVVWIRVHHKNATISEEEVYRGKSWEEFAYKPFGLWVTELPHTVSSVNILLQLAFTSQLDESYSSQCVSSCLGLSGVIRFSKAEGAFPCYSTIAIPIVINFLRTNAVLVSTYSSSRLLLVCFSYDHIGRAMTLAMWLGTERVLYFPPSSSYSGRLAVQRSNTPTLDTPIIRR